MRGKAAFAHDSLPEGPFVRGKAAFAHDSHTDGSFVRSQAAFTHDSLPEKCPQKVGQINWCC